MNAAAHQPGRVAFNGNEYWTNAKGELIPVESVKQHDQVEDDLVRDLHIRAAAVAEAIRLFKEAAFRDVDAFNALLDERYGVKAAGAKGNQTLSTFDGLKTIQVAVADHIEFGAELQQAKALIDECLIEWSKDSGSELRTIISKAFQVDKEGKINAKALLSLKSHAITDPRWVRAMGAIDDSVRITGSKRYVRFRTKDRRDGVWTNIALDIAVA